MIIINSVISITISALKFEYADIGVSNLPVRKGLNCSRNVQVKLAHPTFRVIELYFNKEESRHFVVYLCDQTQILQ